MCVETELGLPFVDDEIKQIEFSVGYNFKNHQTLCSALTRRSYWHENRSKCTENNERMEFLGDAVLNMVVANILYIRFPEANEGELQKRRASLVRQNSLAEVIRELDLSGFIRMGKGDERSGCRERNSILADTLEAIIGAIYLDGGYEEATEFIHNHFRSMLAKLDELPCFVDSKSLLQEKSQALLGMTPVYGVLEEIGEEHSRIFRMGVFIGETLLGSGEGSNKKEAAQIAAANALSCNDWESVQGK